MYITDMILPYKFRSASLSEQKQLSFNLLLFCTSNPSIISRLGELTERPNVLVLKTSVGLSLPRVRIPDSPPLQSKKPLFTGAFLYPSTLQAVSETVNSFCYAKYKHFI